MSATTFKYQQGDRYTQYQSLFVHTCIECGCLFAIPDDLDSKLRENQKSFYCPNGHPQLYSKSKASILQEQLDTEKRVREQEAQRLKSLLFDREQELIQSANNNIQLNKVIKKKTRDLKRLTNGVCPCCNRSFENLANHMKKQHPESVIK